jgi:hypothetical protein
MLTLNIFETTLLSQQIHDTVSSMGRERAISNRRRDDYVSGRRGGNYTSYKSYFVLHYSLLPFIPPNHHQTFLHKSSFFSLSKKTVRTTAHFFEYWIWNRQMGPKTLKSQFIQCEPSMFWCVTREGEESNLFAWWKSDTNTIPRHIVVWTGNEMHTFITGWKMRRVRNCTRIGKRLKRKGEGKIRTCMLLLLL